MELSGSIQVMSGTCHGVATVVFKRDEDPWSVVWYQRRDIDFIVAHFEAEVLRIKEAPHGTDAE